MKLNPSISSKLEQLVLKGLKNSLERRDRLVLVGGLLL